MPVVEFLQHRMQLAAQTFVFAHAEDLRDDVGAQAEHAQLTRALENLVNGKMAAEDEIAAELNLVDRADSSQAQALVHALSGKSIVIQGPPGTGKSQTITNLIAAALAENKTVLFVSEKLAVTYSLSD